MQKLPIDVGTFSIMRENDYRYIDKTKEIYNIVSSGRFFFLARPRRFGKTLFISTLHELFSANKKLFKGLWIEKSDYVWRPYPIINLNFSRLAIETSPELKVSLMTTLDLIGQEHGIDVSKISSLGIKMQVLVETLFKKGPVVILIDEYDYPLINNLTKPRIAEANRSVLKNLFSVIKSLDQYLHAVFLTGVSKFSISSVSSGLNNLNDITLDPLAATLLGYTQEEIGECFKPEIQELMKKEGLSEQLLIEKMKRWYNGYCFSDDLQKVYNPFSVLFLFHKQKFSNYWFESGTPSFLIDLLKKGYSGLGRFDNMQLSSQSLGTFDLDYLPLETILFQTGYLTIKDYNSATHRYTIGYPNAEIEDSFEKYLLANMLIDIAFVGPKKQRVLEYEYKEL